VKVVGAVGQTARYGPDVNNDLDRTVACTALPRIG
jgi:hypothetical protein